ncbi:tyrosine-type recombinase/integrase [Novosphingobium sp. MW5]|nr:tyrosine-type recombinase/integrase [Novosphingobium sp. MW5]
MTATSLRRPFKAGLENAGIKDCRLHALRHTRATRIVRTTGSLAIAKEALKHKSINTTLRYAHVMDDDLRKGLELSDSRNSPGVIKRDRRNG